MLLSKDQILFLLFLIISIILSATEIVSCFLFLFSLNLITFSFVFLIPSPLSRAVINQGACVLNSCERQSETDRATVADLLAQIGSTTNEVCGKRVNKNCTSTKMVSMTSKCTNAFH